MSCISYKQVIFGCIDGITTEAVITTYSTSSIIDYTYYQDGLPTTINGNLTEVGFSTDCATSTSVDFEFGCYSNGTITIEGYSKRDIELGIVKHYDMNNNELIGYDRVECPSTAIDREKIKVLKCNSSGKRQVITFVNVEDTNDIVGPIFINPNGVPSANPGDLVLCNDSEVDGIYTNRLPICINGIQRYINEYSTVDNTNGTAITIKQYKQGANGAITNVTPAGVIIDGYCTSCKKEIIAVEQKYYKSIETSTLEGYDFDFVGRYGAGFDVTNITVTEAQGPFGQAGIGGFLPGNITPLTDITTIQNFIDNQIIPNHNAFFGQGLVIGDIIYKVNADNTATLWIKPGTNIVDWTFVFDNAGGFGNDKFNATIPTIHTLGTSYECVAIQEIKEQNTCTGEESYRYIIENGAGILVSASDIITNFDEINVTNECYKNIVKDEWLCISEKVSGFVPNGEFNDNSSRTFDPSWSISGGVATLAAGATPSQIYQTLPYVIENSTIDLTLSITSTVSPVDLYLYTIDGANSSVINITSTGTQTFTLPTYGSTTTQVKIVGINNPSHPAVSIDNIKINQGYKDIVRHIYEIDENLDIVSNKYLKDGVIYNIPANASVVPYPCDCDETIVPDIPGIDVILPNTTKTYNGYKSLSLVVNGTQSTIVAENSVVVPDGFSASRGSVSTMGGSISITASANTLVYVTYIK